MNRPCDISPAQYRTLRLMLSMDTHVVASGGTVYLVHVGTDTTKSIRIRPNVFKVLRRKGWVRQLSTLVYRYTDDYGRKISGCLFGVTNSGKTIFTTETFKLYSKGKLA